jgi:hypothetical protein
MTEYILILVVVVMLASKLRGMLTTNLGKLMTKVGSEVDTFNNQE